VSADTPHGERDQALAMLKAGRLRCIVNVATMTTGIDVPELDLIALMRNTRSPVLAVQIAGRGMRTAPGKHECLFVDFTDTLATLGPIDLISGRSRPKKDRGEAPFKICNNCGKRNSASARVCTECGDLFEIAETPPHTDHVSAAPALSRDIQPTLERHEVRSVEYAYHPGRDGKLPTLKVTYRGPFMRIASEWICFEHAGYARAKAVAWWGQRAPGTAIPSTIAEAEERAPFELRQPAAVIVNTQPKYPEVTSHEF
jgi:DNA repair protein RadD